MNNEPIFICDPPPRAQYVITCPHPLTAHEAATLQHQIALWCGNSQAIALVLPGGLDIKVLPGRYEWPDAEFCAA